MVGRLKAAVAKAEHKPEVTGLFKAVITKVTPGGDTCFARLAEPKDNIEWAVLSVEEPAGRLLQNKGGGIYRLGERITILKMKKLGDSFTALEIA